MTERVQVVYAGEVYDRTSALYRGTVAPEGIAFRYLHVRLDDVFWRQARNAEYDAAEFSIGAYLTIAADADRRFVAIPVFPSRAFRHSGIYVRKDSDFTSAEELAGKRIGMPEWTQTACLWIRGILQEHHGLDLRSIEWHLGGLEEPGRQERLPMEPPADYRIVRLGGEQTLSAMLAAGELDAIAGAGAPRRYPSEFRLLYDDVKRVELEYFRKTGIFPPMHVVVVRRELLEREPWVANCLVDAFERAKAGCAERLRNPGFSSVSLAWEARYREEEEEALGSDPFPYGIDENRAALDAVVGYAYDQGFTPRRLEPEELFAATTRSKARV